jgi:hypothetical protein
MAYVHEDCNCKTFFSDHFPIFLGLALLGGLVIAQQVLSQDSASIDEHFNKALAY